MSSASRSGCTARAEASARTLSTLAVALLAAAFGCSQPGPTQPYLGTCAPLRVLSWLPFGGSLDVPRDTVIRLALDGYPDPDTIDLGGVIVTTGVFYHGGRYSVDMVEKTISFRATNNLRAQLGYNVTVQPALLSLQGCPAEMAQRSFRTGSTVNGPPPPPPVAVPMAAEVLPLFARTCAGAACHRADDGACLPAPAGAVSLCDAQAHDALVDVPSRQLSRLDLVEPNDSARSYLLRKLLPGETPDRPAPTTLGHRDPPGAPLSRDELHAIARWIDAGASR